MNFNEDEPRKYPKPVPFSQNALLQPTVPEVSLLLQDNFSNDKKSDSFSGTEFQTYNAWRWKHLNGRNDKTINSENRKVGKHSNIQETYTFKDRSYSDIEKRKNEILYGDSDEPRRPLPPRVSPVIPKCTDLFLSPSLDNLNLNDDTRERYTKPAHSITSSDKNIESFSQFGELKKGLDSSDKLYNIISEQHKQMDVLQKQIEQLLKLQEVKDNQIAQLLKSQESKERKIEQILESLEAKDKELENLIKLKDKQDQQLQELLKSAESKRKENLDLLNKLNEIRHKDVQTVGVMTYLSTCDASTNTDFRYCANGSSSKKDNESVPLEEISCIRDLNDSNRFFGKDRSISLHSADLPVIQEHLPTPQSSVHIDIQDFPDSSDECESDSATQSNNFLTSTGTHSNPLGYTFYNNVLTQVKDIIENSGPKENGNGRLGNEPKGECNYVRENLKAMQAFHAWDFAEKEEVPHPEEEKIAHNSKNLCVKESHSPSDISLKINALAMKYLKQEQISQYNLQSQIPASCQRDVTIYNVTNLSFGSMRYLDRYQMLPKMVKNQQGEINVQPKECSPAQFIQKRKKMTVQENITSSIGNILDITTLNQQPKLL